MDEKWIEVITDRALREYAEMCRTEVKRRDHFVKALESAVEEEQCGVIWKNATYRLE